MKSKNTKSYLFLACVIFFTSNAYSQSPAIAPATVTTTVSTASGLPEVRVNWDTKVFESPMPIGQDFVLTIYSANPSTLANSEFVLIGYKNIHAFGTYIKYFKVNIGKRFILTGGVPYETNHTIVTTVTTNQADPASQTVNNVVTVTKTDPAVTPTLPLSTSNVTTTATNTTPTNTKGTQTVETTSQQLTLNSINGSVHYKITKGSIVVNTDYSLLSNSDYTNAIASTVVVKASGLAVVIEKNAQTDTWLSYQDATKRNVTVILGASYFSTPTHEIRPYIGFRLNFLPVDKNLQPSHYNDIFKQNLGIKGIVSHMAFDVGITLSSIKDTINNQYDLFGGSNLMTGLSYRLGNAFFVSSGAMWYDRLNGNNPAVKQYMIKPSWYLSLSFDWDINASFDSIKKALGASL